MVESVQQERLCCAWVCFYNAAICNIWVIRIQFFRWVHLYVIYMPFAWVEICIHSRHLCIMRSGKPASLRREYFQSKPIWKLESNIYGTIRDWKKKCIVEFSQFTKRVGWLGSRYKQKDRCCDGNAECAHVECDRVGQEQTCTFVKSGIQVSPIMN